MNTIWGLYPDEIKPAENHFFGRIINRNRDIYLIGDNQETYNAKVTGKMLYKAAEAAQLPVVGDWVIYELHDDLAIIREILPRFSVISRKAAGVTTQEQPIAANINIVGIVFGLDGGRNYNSRALERYLTIAWNSGAKPLVVLNKADLSDDPEAVKTEAEFTAPGAEVLVTSAQSGEGIDVLRKKIPDGSTVVFIGPSGVGKSALTNALLGVETQATGETRQNDKRGKHTTTTSKMVKIPEGGILIDSPGLREIQLWGETENIDSVFEEISALAENCKFRDCAHQGEPGCAVQQALAEGSLDADRYESYLTLKKEMFYLETKQSERARQEYNAKGKILGRTIKNIKSNKIIY